MTHFQLYADNVLGGNLDSIVGGFRAQGKGWEAIAKELWRISDHKVNVSGQTLRSWYIAPRRQKKPA
jgi:hypothetical protein